MILYIKRVRKKKNKLKLHYIAQNFYGMQKEKKKNIILYMMLCDLELKKKTIIEQIK